MSNSPVRPPVLALHPDFDDLDMDTEFPDLPNAGRVVPLSPVPGLPSSPVQIQPVATLSNPQSFTRVDTSRVSPAQQLFEDLTGVVM